MLDSISWPEDLKKVDRADLPQLAEEIREYILEVVGTTGGHLGSGMGAVELTLALHYLFDFREDRLIFDVGHQCYPHKILTGRKEQMWTLRQKGGLSGFTNRFESPYDVYTMGHAGTAISTALGIAKGDQIRGRKRKVVAVVGDAAFGCGVAFEAMNHGGAEETDLLVVLNDNNWSISKTVGALSSYLSKVRAGALYQKAKKAVHQLLQSVPLVGEKIDRGLIDGLELLKTTIAPGHIFEALGSEYFGPIDGHDLDSLIDTFQQVNDLPGVVLCHVKTQKGKGVPGSENRPDRAHAAKPNPIKKGGPRTAATEPPVVIPSKPRSTQRKAWTGWFSQALIEEGKKDERVVAITAAMPEGTGVAAFQEVFPGRCFDAGIAEQHAIAFASGLADSGLKPVVAIYSTFLQRGYDQIFQEVLLQDLPVVFALDRAGVVGEDGATHNGIFDLAYLGTIPGIVLMAPMDGVEVGMMLDFALRLGKPAALRFPRGTAPELLSADRPPIELGKSQTLREGKELAFVAYGSEVEPALEAAEMLQRQGISAEVVNARFAKPFDEEMVDDLRRRFPLVLTIADHARCSGFGSMFLQCLHGLGPGPLPRVRILEIPDAFQEHASRAELLQDLGLDAEGIARAAQEELRGLEVQHHFVSRLRRPNA
ncbi:MAG TPA: 1-deoxy-D-xylulose-5-phosphate synthase [Planctomycetes bacterium]|nr:1-deoxy-D-xylulose-5-phosphate synthase [Planctomycetota bacterium]